MPTGAGKSMCYQLPAVIKDGTAIVISPLIALMKNQVDQLNALGVNAQFLNSTLSKAEMTKVKKELLEGKVKLLYVAPESLTKDTNVELLKKCQISFVAVDEAHCISEWGHDFRPEYRRIKSIIEMIGDLTIIALTATATPKVRQDIQKNLKMEEADVYLSSFYRENLFYDVRPKHGDTKRHLIKFIKQHKNKSGIIYCLSRKKVEEIAEFLKVNDVKALAYHAGMDAPDRMRNQDAFLNEDVDVIVATIAFGMGIDKPDVRFVVHYDAPKSLEGYYQETGRAGRDGLTSQCLMFFSEDDIEKLEKFNKDKTVSERDNARLLLEEMTFYANSAVCRPRQLLHYFGEYMEKDCGNCDNCKRKRDEFEGKEHILLAIKTVLQTEERFGIEHLALVIIGQSDEYVKSYGHDKLDVFGKGIALLPKQQEEDDDDDDDDDEIEDTVDDLEIDDEELDEEEEEEEKGKKKPEKDAKKVNTKASAPQKEETPKPKKEKKSTEFKNPAEFWISVIRQAMILNFLSKDSENIVNIKITEKGKSFLNKPHLVTLYRDLDFSKMTIEAEEDTAAAAPKSFDETLYDMLKSLRKKIAKQKELPPYVIFQEASLEEMATTYPTTIQDLAQVNGVGMAKAQKWGKPFVDLIAKYVEENDITTATDVVVKSAVSKSKVKIFIIQQIDRKVDLEDIAEAKDMALAELIEEIEHICYSGTKLNLDYYINNIMDEERQEEVYEYFKNAESDKISLALQELGEDDYTEEELRLMRIKFLSEYAL
jgi:ATP-dependent DNA helicase RecQ